MIYKEKVLGLLEVLGGKLRIIEEVSKGGLQLSNEQVAEIIRDINRVKENITDLVSIERE